MKILIFTLNNLNICFNAITNLFVKLYILKNLYSSLLQVNFRSSYKNEMK